MRYLLIVVIVIVVFTSVSASACTPEYSCPDWNACEDGIQTRSCTDNVCGEEPLIERRLCSNDKLECNVKYQCSGWSSCSYLDKTQDILNSKIRFKGYQERLCSDINQCVENFAEQRSCEDSFKVKFVRAEQCGVSFLVALDVDSEREVSQISLDAWRGQKLDISFVQSNFTYCPSCYNGLRDTQEDAIDCGGPCRSCTDEKGISNQVLFISSSWALSLLLIVGFIVSSFANKKARINYLIYKSYRALERGDKPGLAKNIHRLRRVYRNLDEKQKALFKKDLDKLYHRI